MYLYHLLRAFAPMHSYLLPNVFVCACPLAKRKGGLRVMGFVWFVLICWFLFGRQTQDARRATFRGIGIILLILFLIGTFTSR